MNSNNFNNFSDIENISDSYLVDFDSDILDSNIYPQAINSGDAIYPDYAIPNRSNNIASSWISASGVASIQDSNLYADISPMAVSGSASLDTVSNYDNYIEGEEISTQGSNTDTATKSKFLRFFIIGILAIFGLMFLFNNHNQRKEYNFHCEDRSNCSINVNINEDNSQHDLIKLPALQ